MMYAHHLGVMGEMRTPEQLRRFEEGRERGYLPGWRVPADSPRVPCLPHGRARRTKSASRDMDSVQGHPGHPSRPVRFLILCREGTSSVGKRQRNTAGGKEITRSRMSVSSKRLKTESRFV